MDEKIIYWDIVLHNFDLEQVMIKVSALMVLDRYWQFLSVLRQIGTQLVDYYILFQKESLVLTLEPFLQDCHFWILVISQSRRYTLLFIDFGKLLIRIVEKISKLNISMVSLDRNFERNKVLSFSYL